MAQTLTIAGGSYDYPDVGDSAYWQAATDAMVAVCANALWGTGGVVTYLTSATANPAQSGLYRLANTDTIKWRNGTNSADLALDVSSNRLRFSGQRLAYSSEVQTLISPTSANKVLIDDGSGQAVDSTIDISTISTQGYPYANPGKIDVFDDYTAPSATFPYYWLGNADAIITTTNWPDLVPALRAKYLKDGGTEKAICRITLCDINGARTEATLTYIAYSDGTYGAMSARTATKLLHGITKYPYATAPKMTITIPGTGADKLNAGTYYVKSVTTTEATRTIVVECSNGTTTGTGNTGAIAVSAEVYPHRVADTVASATTKAWVYKQTTTSPITYYNGITYNGVLLDSAPGAGSVVRVEVTPEYDQNGTMWCHVYGEVSSPANASPQTFTVTGFDGTLAQSTAMGGSAYGAVVWWCRLQNAGFEYFVNGAIGNFGFFGRVKMVTVPGWFNGDTLPWNVVPAGQSQNAYIWAKTYTPTYTP
jgi:hypothetical protein